MSPDFGIRKRTKAITFGETLLGNQCQACSSLGLLLGGVCFYQAAAGRPQWEAGRESVQTGAQLVPSSSAPLER